MILIGKHITTATVFDAETLNQINFKYEVFDHGSPQNTAICNATVFIDDVNDHTPVFNQLFYAARINVNELTDNRTIAIAEDQDRKRAETFLLVTTGPDNDLYPKFDKRTEPLRIPSTASIGSTVGKVRATAGSHTIKYHISDHRFDVDSWGNIILIGTLQNYVGQDIVENSVSNIITELGDDYQVLLTVPRTSAFAVRDRKLALTSPLDYEKSSSYKILVGNNSETTRRTKTVLVHIIRAAIKDPGISFPSKEISMLMTSSQSVGTKLGRIMAESSLPVKYYAIGSSLIK
ncbi:unnamed protein product, partial [Strongylus vulgaris]